MTRRGAVWAGVFVATALFALGASVYEGLAFALRCALILIALAGFFALSPTRIITGTRHQLLDVLVTLLSAGVAAVDIVRILDIPFTLFASRIIVPASLGALLLAGIAIARTQLAREGGLAWALRARSGALYTTVCAVSLVLLVVAVLHPMLLFVRAISPSVWLITICALVVAFFAWRGVPYAAYVPTLTTPDGVLLALAGAVCARFASEVIPELLLALPDIISTVLIDIVSTSLSALAILVLAALPLMMWRSLLLLRATRDARHIPEWSATRVGCVTGLLTLLVLAPLAHATWTLDGSGISLGITPLPPLLVQPFLVALAIGLIVFTFALAFDRARRLLMVVPFLAATMALAGFVICAFLSAFLAGGASIILAVANGWYPLLLAQIALVGIECLALVLGWCGFVYEVARD